MVGDASRTIPVSDPKSTTRYDLTVTEDNGLDVCGFTDFTFVTDDGVHAYMRCIIYYNLIRWDWIR